MPGRVHLGDDGDEALRGVGGDRPKVPGAVEDAAGLRPRGRPRRGEPPALIVGQVQVQHVELVEREEVDHAPDLIEGEERAGEVERQAAPGVPGRVEDARARHKDLPRAGGRYRGHELDERGQAARDTGRFRGAHDDLIGVDRKGVPFVGRAITGGRDTQRRRERTEFVPVGKLDPDRRFIRYRVAGHRREAQPRAPHNLRAESPDDRLNIGSGARDPRARPQREPASAALEPGRGRYDWVVHRATPFPLRARPGAEPRDRVSLTPSPASRLAVSGGGGGRPREDGVRARRRRSARRARGRHAPALAEAASGPTWSSGPRSARSTARSWRPTRRVRRDRLANCGEGDAIGRRSARPVGRAVRLARSGTHLHSIEPLRHMLAGMLPGRGLRRPGAAVPLRRGQHRAR